MGIICHLYSTDNVTTMINIYAFGVPHILWNSVENSNVRAAYQKNVIKIMEKTGTFPFYKLYVTAGQCWQRKMWTVSDLKQLNFLRRL